jgi:DNA-binding IclR family transcriptional regulator
MSKPHRHRVEQSLTKARDELRLIELVQQMPRTSRDLSAATGLPIRRVYTLIQNLREAHCVYRVPGTHLIAVRDA